MVRTVWEEIELGVARNARRQDRRGQVPTRELATVSGLVGGAIHGVFDCLTAVDVVERGDGRVDRGVPEARTERVVRVLLEGRIRQDPALCGRLDSSCDDIDI